MPTAKNTVENMGTVTMKMFADLGLQNIEVRYIPTYVAYEHYLHGRKIELSLLNL